MLRHHEERLLNYSQHGIRNACAEGFNSAIQLIKANASGFCGLMKTNRHFIYRCFFHFLALAAIGLTALCAQAQAPASLLNVSYDPTHKHCSYLFTVAL